MQRKQTLAAAAIFCVLVIIATTVAYLAAREGASIIASALEGAFLSVALLLAYGGVYQLWARIAWGAPFLVGDKVRIARGPLAGTQGRVVSLGQGVEVEVELELSGQLRRQRFLWGALRRA